MQQTPNPWAQVPEAAPPVQEALFFVKQHDPPQVSAKTLTSAAALLGGVAGAIPASVPGAVVILRRKKYFSTEAIGGRGVGNLGGVKRFPAGEEWFLGTQLGGGGQDKPLFVLFVWGVRGGI